MGSKVCCEQLRSRWNAYWATKHLDGGRIAKGIYRLGQIVASNVPLPFIRKGFNFHYVEALKDIRFAEAEVYTCDVTSEINALRCQLKIIGDGLVLGISDDRLSRIENQNTGQIAARRYLADLEQFSPLARLVLSEIEKRCSLVSAGSIYLAGIPSKEMDAIARIFALSINRCLEIRKQAQQANILDFYDLRAANDTNPEGDFLIIKNVALAANVDELAFCGELFWSTRAFHQDHSKLMKGVRIFLSQQRVPFIQEGGSSGGGQWSLVGNRIKIFFLSDANEVNEVDNFSWQPQ